MITMRPHSPYSQGLLVGALLAALMTAPAGVAQAAHTPIPTSVSIAGSLQSELGCPGRLGAGVCRDRV